LAAIAFVTAPGARISDKAIATARMSTELGGQMRRSGKPETGLGGDIVLVRGDWVYDAGHRGWNEIHPVRYVQRLDNVPAEFHGAAPTTPELVERFKREVLDPWCFEVGRTDDPIVIEAQGEPENSWHIHPSIDGCREPVIVE
jgi:hypothetical protein